MKKIIFTTVFALGILYAKTSNLPTLCCNIYKGEPLQKIRKTYPNSFYASANEKQEIFEMLNLPFLNKMNLVKIETSRFNDKNIKVYVVLNPRLKDRVIGVILYEKSKNKKPFLEDELKNMVKSKKLKFKKAIVAYNNGIVYEKKEFAKEERLHNYLITLSANLAVASSNKALFYIFENFENKKGNGVVYVKLTDIKLKNGCKMCEYLNGSKIIENNTAIIFIYKKDKK